MKRYAEALLAAALVLAACGDDDGTMTGSDGGADAGTDAAPPECAWTGGEAEVLDDPEPHTPRWAFEPWISKDISDREDTFAFVEGFEERDIPVGVVVLDSPWETQYNTFVPHPDRYPAFEGMVDMLHARGLRVVLWTTQMVNRSSFDAEEGGHVYSGPSPNFHEGRICGFFIDDAQTYGWWKGQGAGVDFFDREAVAWWRAQQDRVLEAGIDGWKLDFGEEYITRDPVQTEMGPVSRQEYSEAYYRDFLAYGVHVRGAEDFVTMVRPYDQSYGFPGRFFARPEHAPVAWVGDNHRDWGGLVDALDHMFRSAEAGYVVIGSDIGGYLNVNELDLLERIPFDLEVFQRWTAVGAMTPFMQLHGRANLAPWTVEGTDADVTETVELYRYWSKLHSEMVPFWYSLSEEAYAGREEPPMRPIGDDDTAWTGDWRYLVGEAFLVAPVLEAGGIRDVELPAGAGWYDWWDPAGDPIAGGTTLEDYDASDVARIPLFVREGAIVPMRVRDDVTGHGTEAAAGALTVLVWPGATESTFTLHDEAGGTTTLTAQGASVTLSRAVDPVYLRMRLDAEPGSVAVDGTAVSSVADRAALDAAAEGWLWDPSTRSVWVKLPSSDAELTVTAGG